MSAWTTWHAECRPEGIKSILRGIQKRMKAHFHLIQKLLKCNLTNWHVSQINCF